MPNMSVFRIVYSSMRSLEIVVFIMIESAALDNNYASIFIILTKTHFCMTRHNL